MNEVWNVLTFRDYDFKDERTGRNVKGRVLHCYRETKEEEWPGIEYGKMSVPVDSQAYDMDPELGASYELTFNRHGKVVQMTLVG